ncbi:MAG: peptidase E [Candidatus Dependentiae bacterium]|nr:peptidase E [Candidatus Dependentiae bacterium]
MSTKKQIIAIGGNGLSKDSPKLEQYIIAQTKKANPKICFLPQASSESKEYIIRFYDTFGSLGAKPSTLSLFGRVKNGWEQHLLDQDIIYVGGGNTKSMLALWRAWGVDNVLRQAYEQGTILAGVSAGAICWFEQAVTDSVWPLGIIPGLGFLEGSCCPHYDSEPERRPTYIEKVNSGIIMPGIALQDYVAAHFIDNKLAHMISSKDSRQAFYVSANKEEVINTRSLS